MNILIFGPPGIGKSTTIARLAELIGREHAIDLEDPSLKEKLNIYGWEWMFNDGRLGRMNVIGGADLNPRYQYPNTVKVVLVLDEDEYADRRRWRDRGTSDKSKAKQPAQTVEQWLDIKDAIYLRADENLIYKILKLRETGGAL